MKPRDLLAPAHVWRAYLMAGLFGLVAYFVLPSQGIQSAAYTLFGMAAVGSILVGVRRHRPHGQRAWLLLAGSMTLVTSGDLVRAWFKLATGAIPFPSVADAFYVGGYALLALAVLRLVRGRTPGGDRATLIDAAILTTGIGTVSWVFLLHPYVHDATLTPLTTAVALAYPLADLLLVGVTARLLLAPGPRVPGFWLLMLMLVGFLVGDSAYALLSLARTYQTGQLVDAAWLLGYIGCGALALHPSMVELDRPVERRGEPFGARRLGLVTGASLLAPVVLIAQYVGGGPVDVPILAAASAILFLLVSARLSLVISSQRHTEAGLRRSEEALRASEARYRTLAEQASDGIFIVDRTGRMIDVNQAAALMLGHTREQLLALTVNDLVPTETPAALSPRLATLTAGGTILSERDLPRRDGTTIPVEISARLLPDGRFHGIVRDISERRAAEAERERLATNLRQAAAAFRSVFEDNPAPMWVYALGTLRFLAVNDSAVRSYGYARDEFLAMTIRDIRPSDEVERLLASTAGRRPAYESSGPWRHRRKDGSIVEVAVASHEIEFEGLPARLVLMTDVSDRQALEAQLRQAQKMEAVGRLAGGVAHEFNNLMTAIRGYAELSRLEADPAGEIVAFQDEILRAADRAKALTGRLLAFARKQPASTDVADLASVIRDIAPMLRQVVDERVRLSVELPAEPVMVRVDPSLVEQALLNLAINARDAIEGSGTITIELAREDDADASGTLRFGTSTGSRARLTVTDTGHGIAPEDLGRIFEPFFTTKPVNQGTGLGLSIVYSMATGAGGTVRAQSEIGRGTRFDVFLPLSTAAAPAIGPNGTPPTGSRGGGSERVLLVEDEPAIRTFVTRVLTKGGYQVVSAGSGEKALELAADGPPPAVLVTDVLLPEMSGPDLAAILRRELPDLGVLFVSGYDGDRLAHDGATSAAVRSLAKPFSAAQLLDAMRMVLDPHRVAPPADGQDTLEPRHLP